MGSIVHLSESIRQELLKRLPNQRKTQREALSMMIALMLEVRSPNTNDLASALPRAADRLDMRQQWISRFLSNPHVKCQEIMEPFVREVLSFYKGVLVISMDQSHISEGFELLMISLYWEGRAIPLIWSIHQTGGGVGFEHQELLLNQLLLWLRPGQQIVLMADRFYGTCDLIQYCQSHGWDYRLRLKKNLLVFQQGGEITLEQLAKTPPGYWKNVQLTEKRITTNLGIIHEEGHPEAWMIAMSAAPSFYSTLDYSMRWSIEPMFSDFKSRGFSLENTHLQRTDRIERLILVMALALYWAISTGMWDRKNNSELDQKKQNFPKTIGDLSLLCLKEGCG